VAETPWFTTEVKATLKWSDYHIGSLRFIDPEGHPARISVTHGPSYSTDAEHVWHIEENADGTVTVSPSVHFIGHFHTGNPVVFRLVGALDE
jgi:hypothetical protein